MLPREGAKEFLESLRVPKCLVTDFTVELQYRKLAKLGMLTFFDYIVTSEEVGAEKPAPKIFASALKKLNADASQAAMIGDDFEKDILGAAEFGMQAFWFTPTPRDMPANLQGVQSFTHFRNLEGLIYGR
jgi:putative hydrolase of the HAD superfamily